MKFKPGQKVLVKKDHKSAMVPEMQRFIGKVVTIHSVNKNEHWPYKIAESKRWVWMEAFFTDALDSNNPNILFNIKKGNDLCQKN